MWSMQRYIAQSTFEGVQKFPRPANRVPYNVLVYNYRTSDGRFVQLTDGVGTYAPADGETMTKGALDISVQEGA